MSYSTLKLSVEIDVALLTLNRPEKRNALSPQLIEELMAVFDAFEASSSRVLIVTGEGSAFCSGMDLEYLKGLAGQSAEQNLADARRTVRMFRRLWSFPKPIIAAVNGPALAGGCGIATLADFTLASEEAKFGYTEVRVGFMPALISAFLQIQVGEKIARDLLLSGRVFGAAEAHAMGLVSKVVPAAQLLPAARELAATLIANSPGALQATKRLMVQCSQAELIRRLELGVQESVAIRNTADFKEGLAAFLEKETKMVGVNDFSETTVRVRYAETDQMGVVYYANYLIFFEIGRVEYMRQRGVAYKEMEIQDDSYIVVAESHCRYLRPAHYDDLLRIRTRVAAVRRRTIRFAYEILESASNAVLATGETMHVVCDSKGKPKALPEKYRQYFPLTDEATA